MGDTLAKSYLEEGEVLCPHSGKSQKRVVDAKDIVEELKQGSKGSKRFLVLPKKPLLPLEANTIIRGKLDLRNLIIDEPLEIKNCCFEDEVDLRYCEFKQVVDFSKSTFHKQFNSGDPTHSLTIYHKDLICKDTVFENAACFNRMHVEGDADFTGSRFTLQSPDQQAGTPVEYEYAVDFSDARFGKWLVCDDAIFKGPVSFKAIECGASGSFNRARFITETRIKDEAEITFNWASFKRNFRSREAEYKARLNFRSVTCAFNAFFENARFCEEVDLRFLSVGRDLDLRWVYCAKKAKLGQLDVSKKLALGGACFKDSVELYDSNIGVLELWNPNHPENESIKVRTGEDHYCVVANEGEVRTKLASLETSEAEAERLRTKLLRWGHGIVPFSRNAKEGKQSKCSFEMLFSFKEGHGLNLTSINFERFHGGPHEKLAKRLALKFADDQDPTKFSIDPYLQLRNHYLKIGDETTATAVRIKGYHALCKNAFRRDGRTQWSSKRWITELLLYWPTSYGQRVWHLLLPSIALLFIVGTLMFWQNGSLDSASPEIDKPVIAPLAEKASQRSIYSLDLLIPALDLRYEAMWVPARLPSLIYATVHSILGWILIALLLAWLTGIIKPRD